MSKAMRVLGMMSGTSADGIDVALVRISGAPPDVLAEFEAHHHVSFRPSVRETVLRLANGAPTTTAEISELEFHPRRGDGARRSARHPESGAFP